eukprot:Skav209959  [mRNA]  locus=scaffold2867:10074:15192:+ [translate_table: standard]
MPPLQVVGQATQANGCAPASPLAVPNGQTNDVVKHSPAERLPATRHDGGSGNLQEVQDALQKMRSALHSTSLPEVDAALKVEKTPGVAWGEWETEKVQLVKQLRARRSQIVETVNGDGSRQAPEACRQVYKSTIEKWCQDLQLPQELLTRLNDEDVTDPEELTGVGEKELAALTSGLKIGPKGRFMKAVKRMKALEAAELGSAASLS